MAISHRAFARVGLLGNPSDGYFGKTISFSVENFSATVELTPAEQIKFIAHHVHDPVEFTSLEALAARTKTEGYYGGVRLLMAICTRFYEYCSEHKIELATRKNFTLKYDTNIPRQAGLSGSSAIVCAALSCLLEFYGVQEQVPVDDRPTLILSAETDLGITAGLQDRVIQVYGGLVYMDFDKETLQQTGNGSYVPLDPSLLPPLHLIYADNPSDSGKIHSTVRKRWFEGDQQIIADMVEVAELAREGRTALEHKDYSKLAELMDRNFDLRRRMFGDAALGELNIKMASTARSVGAAAKFTGSGGAVVASCPQGSEQVARLEQACRENDLTCILMKVAPPNVH